MDSFNGRIISARFEQCFDVISLSLKYAKKTEKKSKESNLTSAVLPEIQFLLNVLIDDEFFIGAVLSKCSEAQRHMSRSYINVLLLIVKQLAFEISDVIEKWFVEDLMGTTVIDLLFKHLPNVSGEVISSTHKSEMLCPSYDEICSNICELLPVIPTKSFSVIENCLISNLLSENVICVLLASDAWYFLMLIINENLRMQHCQLLFKFTRITSGFKQRNVKVFLERILPLMNQSQIEELMTQFNPIKYPVAWNQSYNCDIEKQLCTSFLQNYDYRKTSSNILPLVSSFISKAENIDKKYREKLIFILLVALKHNIEERNNIDSIPDLINALARHATHLHRDVISSLSYSFCYSSFQEDDTFKYLFCHLCNSFIHSTTNRQQRALIECLVKCCSEQRSHYTTNLLYGYLLYLCSVHENLDKISPLINSKREVRERLIEFIETKQSHLSNSTTDEQVILIHKLFTISDS